MVAILKGCSIRNKGQMIVGKKNGLKVQFNKEIKTKNGFVCGVMLAVMPAVDCLLAMVAMANCCRVIDINKLHQKLRHAWAQAHGVNMIPDNDNNTNLVAPIADVDEDEEFDVNEHNDDKEKQALAHPMPATNKTL